MISVVAVFSSSVMVEEIGKLIVGVSLTSVTVTVTVWVSLRPPASVTFTVTTYSLLVPPDWVGVSKSGAFENESVPEELMVNLPPSSPLSTDHVSVSDASTSSAANVWTAVVFSGTDLVAGGDVITGASLTSVTVTWTMSVVLRPPASLTLTVTSYTLSVPASAGISKLGALANLSSPCPSAFFVMVKSLASAPCTSHVSTLFASTSSAS